jgi:glyoxylase-like metal-dependent hydrolase (beta-lactamase superfamily II)
MSAPAGPEATARPRPDGAPDLAASIVPVTPFEQNCTIVWDKASGEGVVVDPGGEVPRLREALAKLAVRATAVLLTHGHADHAAGAAELAESLGVPVIGPHRADAFLLDALPQQAARFGMAGRAVTPDRWLEEGDTVAIGGAAFEVRHCPGHTPGHVVFVNVPARVVIGGDVLFRGSIGRTDFPYGDHAALIAAIRGKLLTLPDDTLVLCGHGPATTIGDERRGNPFLRGVA